LVDRVPVFVPDQKEGFCFLLVRIPPSSRDIMPRPAITPRVYTRAPHALILGKGQSEQENSSPQILAPRGRCSRTARLVARRGGAGLSEPASTDSRRLSSWRHQ